MLFADEELQLPTCADLRDGDPPSPELEEQRRWPISLSALASLLLHAAVMVAVGLLLEQDFLSNNVTTFPSFDVTLVANTSDVQINDAAQPQPTAPAESKTEKSDVQHLVDNSTSTVADVPVVEADNVLTPEELSIEQPVESVDQPIPVPEIVTSDLSDIVVAESEGVTQLQNDVESPPAIQPLTKQQQTMFAKRVKDWEEDLNEIVDEGDSLTWEDDGQVYTATVNKVPPENEMDLERAVVNVSTQVNGKTLATKMQMKRIAFSHYGQFVDRWDDDVALFNDEIEGRFHSNTTIKIESSRGVQPHFFGRVTTARTAEFAGRTRRDEIFLGGLETRVKRIRLPRDIAPAFYPAAGDFHKQHGHEQNDIEQDNYHYIDGDADIVFYSNGEYSWTNADNNAAPERRRIGDDAYYIMAGDDSELSVRGVIKGRVVVYSPDVVSIVGNLRYAQDPEVNPASTDFLALISDKYVEVASPDVTGPGDLTVYAAIYAKRRFSIKRFRNNNKGLLTIYGSLSAGSLSASEPRYATLIRFDKRFENQRPPGYPMTERYELEQWNGAWELVN